MISTSRPIIVVGPGRCGTSMVSRILIGLGVDMGRGFTAHESNPDGFFEDQGSKELNIGRLGGKITPDLWRSTVLAYAHAREVLATGSPWGWKDPRTAEFIDEVVAMFPAAQFVRCQRPFDDVVGSFVRWYNFTSEQASEMVKRRESNLDRCLPIETMNVEVEKYRDHPDWLTKRLAIALGRRTSGRIER